MKITKAHFEKAMNLVSKLAETKDRRYPALGWAYFNFADGKFPKAKIVSSPLLTDSDKEAILNCFK